MKKLVLLLVAAFALSICYAQKLKEADVPANVKAAFAKQFPGATKVKWEKEDANFEVSFDMNGSESSALIDASGNILETEVEIEVSALPAAVRDYMVKNHAGKKISEAAKITDAKGVVTYEVEIKGKDLLFDSKGNFIKED